MPPENAQEFEAEIFRKCAILESIASQYAPTSPEYQAVREAAEALSLVLRRKSLRTAFQELKSRTGLTPEMAENLRRMGIDPDEICEDDDS